MNRATRAISRAAVMGEDRSSRSDGSDDDESGGSSSYQYQYPDPIDDPKSKLAKFLNSEKSIGRSEAFFYSLQFQPSNVRRERVVMVAESYSIFGALFLNGVWFLWEYGNSVDFEYDWLRRLFEICCAINMISNVFLAMFGCFLWVLSALHSAESTNWCFSCAPWLADFHVLQFISFFSTFLCLGVAVYNQLKEMIVVAILLPVLMAIFCYRFVYHGAQIMAWEFPLEMYHMPMYFKCGILYPIVEKVLFPNQKEECKRRAGFLKHLAKHERQRNNPSNTEEIESDGDLTILLAKAAHAIGKKDADVQPYVDKLKKDWYDDVNSLRGESAEMLSKYMPRRLAKQVHQVLDEDGLQ